MPRAGGARNWERGGEEASGGERAATQARVSHGAMPHVPCPVLPVVLSPPVPPCIDCFHTVYTPAHSHLHTCAYTPAQLRHSLSEGCISLQRQRPDYTAVLATKAASTLPCNSLRSASSHQRISASLS